MAAVQQGGGPALYRQGRAAGRGDVFGGGDGLSAASQLRPSQRHQLCGHGLPAGRVPDGLLDQRLPAGRHCGHCGRVQRGHHLHLPLLAHQLHPYRLPADVPGHDDHLHPDGHRHQPGQADGGHPPGGGAGEDVRRPAAGGVPRHPHAADQHRGRDQRAAGAGEHPDAGAAPPASPVYQRGLGVAHPHRGEPAVHHPDQQRRGGPGEESPGGGGGGHRGCCGQDPQALPGCGHPGTPAGGADDGPHGPPAYRAGAGEPDGERRDPRRDAPH